MIKIDVNLMVYISEAPWTLLVENNKLIVIVGLENLILLAEQEIDVRLIISKVV